MNIHFQIIKTGLIAAIACAQLTAASSTTTFKQISGKAAVTPTMRQFHEMGALNTRSGGFKDAELFKATRFIAPHDFEQMVDQFLETMHLNLRDPLLWRGKTTKLPALLDKTDNSFTPYAQKIEVGMSTPLIFKGDLHGDAHSLIKFLKQLQDRDYTSRYDAFSIVDPDLFLVFLGDYVDRGLWGVEVMYLLMQLKIKNPHQVILVRGNHEDPMIASIYGFKQEFYNKFSDMPSDRLDALYTKIAKVYECLPVVLYLGARSDTGMDFVQCCHGGMEMGFNPKKLLNAHSPICFEEMTTIKRASACKDWHLEVSDDFGNRAPLTHFCQDFTPITPTGPFPLGFMWHDFVVDPHALCSYSNGRGFACNRELTLKTLDAASTQTVRLSAVIRAHQHCAREDDPMMKLLLSSYGCGLLWQNPQNLRLSHGTVITLLLSPDSMVGIPHFGGGRFKGFSYDTFLEVSIGNGLSDWKLTVINN